MTDFAREAPAPVLRIKLRRPAAATLARIAGALGVDLPEAPNTVAMRDGVRVAWIGPDDWLVTGAGGALGAVEAAIAGETGLIRDVGAGHVRFRVSGAHAVSLLAQGTGLDLDLLAPGRCAMTLFAQIHALIERVGPDFIITVDVSCARYLDAWLAAAAAGRRERDR